MINQEKSKDLNNNNLKTNRILIIKAHHFKKKHIIDSIQINKTMQPQMG
jgi:hypothetical protein